MNQLAKEPCIKCGTLINANHPVSLRTVMQLSNTPPSEYVDKIVEAEGIASDLAQEFVDHKMSFGCMKNEPPCPNCGTALKTWHAVSCLKCDWKREANRQLPEYYK
ncbi:MAG: hypothetical protein Q8R67_22165 [Rhodoferax sp.]|nr:hypothetical protein [Rhodoferax sp.]MDP3654379.1 hypothetical protein [Rhodoferax sp.]